MNPKNRGRPLHQPSLLLVDHDDSFTHNLSGWFSAARFEVRLVKSRDLGIGAHPASRPASFFQGVSGVVFSPGPGKPSDYPASRALLNALPASMPVLGVCLGHQILLEAVGGRIEPISECPRHGRRVLLPTAAGAVSRVCVGYEYVGRFVLFNSLGCRSDDPVFAAEGPFSCLAAEDGFALVAEHKVLPRLGVQFHPESFASPGGESFLRAFAALCARTGF